MRPRIYKKAPLVSFGLGADQNNSRAKLSKLDSDALKFIYLKVGAGFLLLYNLIPQTKVTSMRSGLAGQFLSSGNLLVGITA